MPSDWFRSFKRLQEAVSKWTVCDRETRDQIARHIRNIPHLERDSTSGLIPEQMFWPPRVVNNAEKNKLLLFFGSGVSFAAKLPSWMGLLREVGLDIDIEKDPHVSGDMLTLAELAAHACGTDALQETVRNAVSTDGKDSTIAHFLLSALAQKIYITTNYDDLFEISWRKVHNISDPKIPRVITTDDDLVGCGKNAEACAKTLSGENNCVLFKLHGCAKRHREHLVLTRSDYRRHYRTNKLFFDTVTELMATGHTLFLGFGHRDPEIARLIDDVVHHYEKSTSTRRSQSPGLYSLQFGMKERTPEIFAARGIVALQPRFVLPRSSDDDVRGISLGSGLADLLHNADAKMTIHKELSLDKDLARVADFVEHTFSKIKDELKKGYGQSALDIVSRDSSSDADRLMEKVMQAFPEFSNQGCYLVRSNGILLGAALPAGLDRTFRFDESEGDFSSRPYFRQATSHREFFVSDTFKSIFNHNSTLAICLPLLAKGRFSGLLFLAYQLTDTAFVQELKAHANSSKGDLIVVDSNGILLLPPNDEIDPGDPVKCDKREDVSANRGFAYNALFYLSRRDKRAERISQSVVPLAQDDDVFPLGGDSTLYSAVRELKVARWKIALVRFFPRSFTSSAEDST